MQRPFLEDNPKTEAPTTPLPSLPAHPRKLILTRGGELQVVHVVPPGCRPPPDDGERGRPRTARAFAPVMAQRFGAFFMVVEGIPPSAADLFHRRVRQALSVERGLTTSRLMRAVSAGCEAVEGQLLHRYQLAAFGVTAVLVESTLHPYVSMSQLPPGQAYLLDTGVLKAIPEEQMWRAEQVASPEGRSWPVELDLERLTVHPGATIMLCSSVLGARLSATTVKEVLQLPLEQATQALFEAWREVTRRQDLSELGEALLIRFPESETQPRVRLFAPPAEASRRRAAAPPAARRFSGDAAVRDPEASWIDPPLHRWGLEGERQQAIPILGSVIDWVTGVQRAVPRPRRRRRGPLLAAGALALAAAGAWAIPSWWRQSRPRPAPPTPPPAIPTATAPRLAGRSLLVAADPLLAFAVAGRGEAVYLVDTTHRLRRIAPGTPPAGATATPAGTPLPSATGTAPQPSPAASPPARSAGVGTPTLAPTPPRAEGVAELRGTGEQLAAQLIGLAAPSLFTRRGDTLLWLDAERRLQAWQDGRPAPQAYTLRNASSWGRPVAMTSYAGNLYVLDVGDERSGGQIWRYPGGDGETYETEPQPWLLPNSGVSLRGATGFAIDGSIWVARDDGGILLLTGGRAAPYQIAGLDTPIGMAGAIYTEPSYRSIYVVDAAARRLVQLSKTGQFERQVRDVIPTGERVHGLWVDESSGRALVLTDRRLQELVSI